MVDDQITNAIETMVNLLYLIKIRADEPQAVRALVEMSEGPVHHLLELCNDHEPFGMTIRERVLACLKAHQGTPYCAGCIARELGIPLEAAHKTARYLTSRGKVNRLRRKRGQCGGPCKALRLVSYLSN